MEIKRGKMIEFELMKQGIAGDPTWQIFQTKKIKIKMYFYFGLCFGYRCDWRCLLMSRWRTLSSRQCKIYRNVRMLRPFDKIKAMFVLIFSFNFKIIVILVVEGVCVAVARFMHTTKQTLTKLAS